MPQNASTDPNEKYQRVALVQGNEAKNYTNNRKESQFGTFSKKLDVSFNKSPYKTRMTNFIKIFTPTN